MTTDGDIPSRLERVAAAPTWVHVAAIVAVGLLGRLVWLGWRVAHFDEGRVAYWTLRFMETGRFEYRYIIHGPFVQHLNTYVWTLLGPTDFSARLIVALVGAALPLVALLFREYLSDREVVAVALFLAFNPVLLYYSRFLRSDVLVATFMVFALGFLLRAYHDRRPLYLYAASVSAALGFSSKENALVYVLCFLGAGALVLDASLYRPHDHVSGFAVVRERVGDWRARLRRLRTDGGHRRTGATVAGHVAGALGVFLVVLIFMYAPRAGATGGVGLDRAVANPGMLPAVVDAALLQSAEEAFGYWFGQAGDPGCNRESLVSAYACFSERFLLTMGRYATAVSILSVGGFVYERYVRARSREFVLFCSYWGFASVVGYPLAADIWGAWVTVHAIVPLSVPAGVGLGLLVGETRAAYEEADVEGTAIASVLILLLIGGTVVTGVQASFVSPQQRESPSDMVQFAQPEGHMQATLGDVRAIAGSNDGVDVLYYGEQFYLEEESDADWGGAPGGWFERLPLPWYTEAAGADVASVRDEGEFDQRFGDSPPPVVIAPVEHTAMLDDRLEGYERNAYALRAPDHETDRYDVVVFVDPDARP